ncbi:MAG: penicillin-binding protein 2 [Candidatus Dojkabacteria bacterium]|nr:penicillin-binding protein 2 [Candidatus Dojkabacteria bacterium]
MELKISKKLQNGIKKNRPKIDMSFDKDKFMGRLKKFALTPSVESTDSSYINYIFVFVLFFVLFFVLIANLSTLQVVRGQEMLGKSENNQIKIETDSAYRGVIFDRNGVKLAENLPSMSLYLELDDYLEDGEFNSELLKSTSDTLEGILKGTWKKTSSDGLKEYESIYDKVISVHSESPYFTDILIATDISNDIAIQIKSRTDILPGIHIDNGSKRYYKYGSVTSHILGYTGNVSATDLEKYKYLIPTDVVGKTGLERQYDEQLRGKNGQTAIEVDALGRTISEEKYVISEAESGDSLYLTIDIELQKQFYEFLKKGVKSSYAVGGAGIIQDVETGEILAIVSYPSYDNNLFVGGISYKDYASILKNKSLPLINRAISVQMPPGSTFKSIVAPSALDAGAITRYTKYTSKRGYTFSNGALFKEFNNAAYGTLTVVDAIQVSSNIFFCELIRDWDMNELVPYLEKFGIGQYTGIDIPGEEKGRTPSPANKREIALTTSPWLDPVWYPEGDSCNSVIGQGITLVTPIQMSNWMAAIATDGILNTPHLAKTFLEESGDTYTVPFDIIRQGIVSKDALKITKEGMWAAVNGPRRSVGLLSGLGVQIAAKTGTAEFGRVNSKGEYEDTHAWVGGFFPFDNPKYSFSVFLEDGGHSSNAVKVARDMIQWMVKEEKI